MSTVAALFIVPVPLTKLKWDNGGHGEVTINNAATVDMQILIYTEGWVGWISL